MTRSRRAFTVIELLVVLAIILVLAGLLLGVATVLRGQSKDAQTRAIISIILQAIETQRMDKGGVPAACEHPLAGTAPPAAVFSRADGTPISFATTRAVIRGPAALGQVDPSLAGQVALPDDIFADTTVPLLYGLRRDRCTILGPVKAGVTWVHQVSPPTQGALAVSALDPTASGYPRIGSLQGGPAFSATAGPEQTRSLDYLLGAGGHEAELLRLGAVRSPPDDDPAKLIRNQRVWSDPSLADPQARVPASRLGDGTPYLLRGKCLYDAFGHELLYCVLSGGAVQILSAGRDGCFGSKAGADGVLGTADDMDASTDNIVLPQGGVP